MHVIFQGHDTHYSSSLPFTTCLPASPLVRAQLSPLARLPRLSRRFGSMARNTGATGSGIESVHGAAGSARARGRGLARQPGRLQDATRLLLMQSPEALHCTLLRRCVASRVPSAGPPAGVAVRMGAALLRACQALRGKLQ